LRILEYKVTDKMKGKQIKNILKYELGVSGSLLTKLKKYPEGIMVNDRPVYANVVVNVGDRIKITIKDSPSVNIVGSDIKLEIIYEDEDILVVNKPRSMPTHPSQNHHNDTLVNAVAYQCPDIAFRVITRLDRDTSGVVLIAKNKLSAAILSKSMKNGEIYKKYCAVCHGCPSKEKGIIEEPIARKQGSLILREVNPLGKKAITQYEVLGSENGLSFIALRPLTGRTHQLRVHLSHLGVPIYGDDMYGSPCMDEKFRLHCKSISFIHPVSRIQLCFDAPIPQDMLKFGFYFIADK